MPTTCIEVIPDHRSLNEQSKWRRNYPDNLPVSVGSDPGGNKNEGAYMEITKIKGHLGDNKTSGAFGEMDKNSGAFVEIDKKA